MKTDVESYLKEYRKLLCQRAEELIGLPLGELTEASWLLYFETGDRLTFEKQYFGRREQLTVFGLISCLWEEIKPCKTAYIKRALETCRAVLEEKTWVLPAHGVGEHLTGERISIDLFAAETAGALSEILYKVKDNPMIREMYWEEYKKLCRELFRQLRRRIFNVFFEKNPCDWWEQGTMNWTSVCTGNIFIAAFYAMGIQKEMPDSTALSGKEFREITDRTVKAMKCYLSGMGKDGACTEGSSYYKYGMEYFLKCYELLQAMGEQESLAEFGDLRELFLFLQRVYLGCGNTVNFADCSIKTKQKIGMLSYMSYLCGEVETGREFFDEENKSLMLNTEITELLGGEECHRWLGAYSDYMWVKRYGSLLKAGGGESHLFPDTMWYIKKWGGGTAFYIKGGNNGESHNHNDVGSFGYIVKGEEMLCDLGAGEYTRDYFGEKRYDILCTGSRGHNVPMIGGSCQQSGECACADRFTATGDRVEVSFLRAYLTEGQREQAEGKFVKREIFFDDKGGFKLRDSFCLEALITEVFVSRLKPEIVGNRVLIRGKRAEISITYGEEGDMPLRVYVETEQHREHDGERTEVYLVKADYENKEPETVVIIRIKSEKDR